MSGHNIASRSSEKLLFFGFLVLVRSVLCHGFAEEFTSGSYDFGSVILEPLDGLRKYAESIVGTHAIEIGAEFVEMLLKFVAEGAASGLNVIAVYVSEILRATGVNETVSVPHFTAEGVSAVTKWALLALIAYWLLSLLLRVTVMLVKRVFWLIKAVVVLWLFVRIIGDPAASNEVTTMRLILLVLTCAVFGVATSSGGGTGGSLESRMSKLEGQVKGLEKMKMSSNGQ
ncbi:transmembrane protein 109 isoform X2 [Carassius auratus]|uniref:Transmembrane protein 109 isoform X2 n=1 Tax=Carassius auratus TaxID=7957 RepID=A0A6P6MR47_CARAU|nr:transmembrane protein 109-like isoform X2 [Carassius auratus]XP_052471675.1 transmembrane protein 109 isoform X2 [Carassius gibelio]